MLDDSRARKFSFCWTCHQGEAFSLQGIEDSFDCGNRCSLFSVCV